jgi:hypothetical protein
MCACYCSAEDRVSMGDRVIYLNLLDLQSSVADSR